MAGMDFFIDGVNMHDRLMRGPAIGRPRSDQGNFAFSGGDNTLIGTLM